MTEGNWHKKVRINLIKKYENEGYRVESSHGDKSIRLYRGKPSDVTFLSEADIVLFNDEHIEKIIEIKDQDITPKIMVGTIETTDLCDRCKVNNEIYDLQSIELLIVYKKQKEASVKSDQLQLIKENLIVDGCLKDFDFEVIDE